MARPKKVTEPIEELEQPIEAQPIFIDLDDLEKGLVELPKEEPKPEPKPEPEPTKMTMKEINEHFGKAIEIIE